MDNSKKKLKDENLPPKIFEGNLINAILRDQDNIKFYRDNINPDNFSFQPAIETVRLIFYFYDKYKRAPEEDELTQELAEYLEKQNKPIPENFFTDLWQIIFEPSDIEYPRDKLLEWMRSQALKKTMLEAAKFEEKGQTMKAVSFILEKLEDIKRTGIPKFGETIYKDVQEANMEWLWRNKIPMATISLIVGYQGVSKSYFSTMLAAAVSKGQPLPGEHYENFAVKGSVVILSAEDDPETTIKRRLRMHDADQEKIRSINISKNYETFNLKTDLQNLDDMVKRIGDVKLIIIDPVSAYLGADMRFDSYRETHVRSVLAPVAELARKYDLAIIGIMHLNKREDAAAINRVSGSGAFVAAARAVWLIAKAGMDEGLFYFCPLKFNLGEKPKGLAYRIKNERIHVEDFDSEENAEELLAKPDTRSSQRQDAKEFLRELIKIKREWDAEEIERKAKEEGIAMRTLNRAKKDLKMKSIKVEGEDGKVKWVWEAEDKKK